MGEFERSLTKVLVHDLGVALKLESVKLFRPYTPIKNRNAPCEVEWCGNVAYAKNLCNAHYTRSRTGKDMNAPFQHRSRKLVCLECEAPVDGKGGWGLCKSHYRTRRRKIIRSVCVQHLGGECRNCGGVFPDYVFDFHHLSPESKLYDPALVMENKSIEEIAAEVEKCELLCANCHRIEHHG